VSIVASENEFCKNQTSKDTITTVDSEVYDSIGGYKHSLDQDTARQGPMLFETWRQYAEDLSLGSKN
jgi:hypothetical protein